MFFFRERQQGIHCELRAAMQNSHICMLPKNFLKLVLPPPKDQEKVADRQRHATLLQLCLDTKYSSQKSVAGIFQCELFRLEVGNSCRPTHLRGSSTILVVSPRLPPGLASHCACRSGHISACLFIGSLPPVLATFLSIQFNSSTEYISQRGFAII